MVEEVGSVVLSRPEESSVGEMAVTEDWGGGGLGGGALVSPPDGPDDVMFGLEAPRCTSVVVRVID